MSFTTKPLIHPQNATVYLLLKKIHIQRSFYIVPFIATVYCYVYGETSNLGFWFGTRIGVKRDGSTAQQNIRITVKYLLLDTINHVVPTKSFG